MTSNELTLGVTLAVLGAGLLHAAWNALLKSAPGGDPMLDTAAVVGGSSVACLFAVPFVPLPHPAAWAFMAASSAIHFAYYFTLAQAYRTGDLSFAYPLMRGTAPLLVTVLGIVFLHEWPTPQVAVGIALICAGIVSIAFIRRERHPRAAARWAFANAAIIACYTLVDGAGARASGAALSYVSWLCLLEGLPFLLWIRWRRGADGHRVSAPRRSARPARRDRQRCRLRHRALGDDARARRCGVRVAGDFGALRRRDRRPLAARGLRLCAHGRRRERGRRHRHHEALNDDSHPRDDDNNERSP